MSEGAERAERIFVSSTSTDLVAHRDAVKKALTQAGFKPIGMEDFMARAERPLEVCLQEVAGCDLFIGIYAWRYGFVPPGHPVSITEEELREARRRGKPCICFVVDPAWDWPDIHREQGEGAQKLRELKAWVGDNVTWTTFTTPEDLATRLLASILRRDTTPVTPERRKLLRLLAAVREAWIEGVLEPSTAAGALEPEREERPAAVLPAWEGVRTDAPRSEPGLPLHELFRKRQRSLLILGEPGAGKTTALLRLLRSLASEAERAPEEPVPVYFDLSSWAERRGSLADWLAREIRDRYRFDLDTAGQWLRAKAIVPLLDGLDEVEQESRPDCVAAIHEYLAACGEPGMVVCCRSQEYEELPQRLKLESAVLLAPLTAAVVGRHLAAGGPDLASLREALTSDAELRDMAQSPLWLVLLAGAFRGTPAPALSTALAAPDAERRERVLASYVERMEKRPGSHRYAPERTRRSLAWLARGMLAHNLAWFQIEELQASWLAGRSQRWLYSLVSRGLGGLLLLSLAALLLGPLLPSSNSAALVTGIPALLLWGIAIGLLVGATDHLWPDPAVGSVQRWSLRVLVLGGEALLLATLVPRVDSMPAGLPWTTWLVVSLLVGLIFGFRPGGERDTRVFEELRAGWSCRGALVGAGVAVSLGLMVWAFWWANSLPEDRSIAPRSWIIMLGLSALVFAPLAGLLAGLEGRAKAVREKPNLGIRRALANTGRVTLRLGGTLTLLLALVVGGIEAYSRLSGKPGTTNLWTEVFWVTICGLIAGLLVGLWFSGMDILQHFTLRLLLTASGRFPARWPRFLTHACERGLLRRAGGSYVFANRLLRDWFAGEGT